MRHPTEFSWTACCGWSLAWFPSQHLTIERLCLCIAMQRRTHACNHTQQKSYLLDYVQLHYSVQVTQSMHRQSRQNVGHESAEKFSSGDKCKKTKLSRQTKLQPAKKWTHDARRKHSLWCLCLKFSTQHRVLNVTGSPALHECMYHEMCLNMHGRLHWNSEDIPIAHRECYQSSKLALMIASSKIKAIILI